MTVDLQCWYAEDAFGNRLLCVEPQCVFHMRRSEQRLGVGYTQ